MCIIRLSFLHVRQNLFPRLCRHLESRIPLVTLVLQQLYLRLHHEVGVVPSLRLVFEELIPVRTCITPHAWNLPVVSTAYEHSVFGPCTTPPICKRGIVVVHGPVA
ncbi:hypothetical protein KC19_10G099400 [Ceratodon purpureus]|uniref:Uncharacterized protein n=1 Tax=Ceratodon purpureus TaxID=3225 RepID=A0A8T0GNQ4_CERPU|nr:hypothetical protein KC19_10G099400 [Ceratodon purpureus]